MLESKPLKYRILVRKLAVKSTFRATLKRLRRNLPCAPPLKSPFSGPVKATCLLHSEHNALSRAVGASTQYIYIYIYTHMCSYKHVICIRSFALMSSAFEISRIESDPRECTGVHDMPWASAGLSASPPGGRAPTRMAHDMAKHGLAQPSPAQPSPD